MICHECGRDDKEAPPDDLPIAEVVRLCREWKCKLCLRTPEQVQADFAAEAARNPHKSAHDWDDILKTTNEQGQRRRQASAAPDCCTSAVATENKK